MSGRSSNKLNTVDPILAAKQHRGVSSWPYNYTRILILKLLQMFLVYVLVI